MKISARLGRKLAACAAAGLLTTVMIAVARPAGADPVLLSQGKPTTASSTENAGSAAANATDGNAGTRWSSAFSDPQWLQVDLGTAATITQVSLNWEAAYATAFSIQVSDNATSWTTIYSTTTSTGGNQTIPVTGTGRYVRMNGTARATQYGYSLWEFGVYGSTGTCGTANAAQGKTATASSVENVAFPASNTVDGNTTTRWSSAFSDPQWVQIDLGSSQPVCQVIITWEAAYATAFQIQLSNDAATWTTIYSTTTGTGGTQTINVSGTGRYLRVYMTARATQWGDSILEIVVHTGTGTASPSPSTPTSASPSPAPSTSPSSGQDILLSYNKNGVASTSQDDANCTGCLPAKAFDANPATRWATSATTGWVDPGWIYVDLGATATIHKVVLQWDPAYAVSYQIQTSNDAANWTNIYSTTTGKGFKETLTGLNGTGRYVRMYGTARSNGYGYSMWGFDVYGTGGAPSGQPPTYPAPNFTHLVWSDEFNAAAGTHPDAAKWTPETGPGVNGELEYYTNNNNAYTDGAGNMVLEAKRETTAGSACPGGPCQYTSARFNTQNKYTFTYGHVEARIKVSGTQGLWPAFWLLGANFPTAGWPYCGEIDIMEHVGKVANATYSTIHAPAYNGGGGIGAPYTIGGDFMSDFHVFAVDWDSTHMTFYVDGVVFETLNKDTVETTRGPWVYDHPFFIILNNAVGGDWPGAPDATTVLPQKMLVDYVRVYQ